MITLDYWWGAFVCTCDACGANYGGFYDSMQAARTALEGKGWTFPTGDRVLALCPKCKAVRP